MDSSIDSIKDRDITYAYQMFPLDKVKEEVVAYKAKKEKEEQEKKQTSSSEDGNISDNGLASRSLSPTGELDPETKAELDTGDHWQKVLENYLSQPLTLYRFLNPNRSDDKERGQFYLQLIMFIKKCKDCSDAKPNEEEKKYSEEDSKLTLEEVSHMSKEFKRVHTPHDLATFEYCSIKFREMINEFKRKDKEEEDKPKEMIEDGVVVQIQIRKSDTSSTSHYGRNPYSSSTALTKDSWKPVGDAPIVARISPTLSVSGLREMLGRRLACGALKLKTDEHHSNGDDSLPSPVLSIMNQVALSLETKHRYGGGMLGTVTMDQLAENPKTPVFANPKDQEEKELVTEIVNSDTMIVVNWPTQLNDILDVDLLSMSDEYLTAEQQKEKEDEANKKNGVSVMDCIAKYCEREQLDESDAWYCNQCKEHVRAWKQFSMYTPPPILIVHLKRFHYSQTTHRRDKIDTLIDFPLTDLDLRGVVKHSNWDHEPIYDCYAVSNHFGGLGGGHYTAYARGDDGTWSNFDDSRVTSNVDESEVVSKAAYCLYYKRKDIVFDKDDDVRMTTDEDVDPHVINRFLMPVSPGPSPDIDNNDTMDTASQTSTTEAASYATPCGSLTGEPSMDESEGAGQNNIIVDDDVFSDAETELGQSLYRQ